MISRRGWPCTSKGTIGALPHAHFAQQKGRAPKDPPLLLRELSPKAYLPDSGAPSNFSGTPSWRPSR